MTENDQKQLGKALWAIADQLRGAMNADDFRDYMLSFLFLRYLSWNYEESARKELGADYPDANAIGNGGRTPLSVWYANNAADVPAFEQQMRRKAHYVIKPEYLWGHIVHLATSQSGELLKTLYDGFKYIEEKSFDSNFQGLFSEINLYSEKLGKRQTDKNDKLCAIISEIAKGIAGFSADVDALGDAYEYLIGQFAAGSGKKAGEFYTPQQISNILSAIVTLDSQEPKAGPRSKLDSVFDFACGSGSLLLNVRHRMKNAGGSIGRIYGMEKNITTYNLARMNMLLHGVKDTEFEIYHGDTLTNDWDFLRETNPAKKPQFDAVVANPPFSYRWEPGEAMAEDMRFKNHGVAPKSAADFAFLLHGLHYLKDDGVMAIILPHGALFRGGKEADIRTKLLTDGHIDTVIGLPANLFYSTGIPVCILVLKKCKKPDDVLFINAADHFVRGKRQNQLTNAHIERIVRTYQCREEQGRYSKRVSMKEIVENSYNLNISRYVSTAREEVEVDLAATHNELVRIDNEVREATAKHNAFLGELGLPLLPGVDSVLSGTRSATKNVRQAITSGLVQMRRGKGKVRPSKTASKAAKKKTRQDVASAGSRKSTAKHSGGPKKALKTAAPRTAAKKAVGTKALSGQAKKATKKPAVSSRSVAARKAARTKGSGARNDVAKKVARKRRR